MPAPLPLASQYHVVMHDNSSVPANRIVAIGSDDYVDLANASTTNAIAVTEQAASGGKVVCRWLNITTHPLHVTSVDAADAGDLAMLAADGKVQSGGGTLRLGVYVVAVEAGAVAEIRQTPVVAV